MNTLEIDNYLKFKFFQEIKIKKNKRNIKWN